MQTARLGRLRPLIPRRQICSECAERRHLDLSSSRPFKRFTPGSGSGSSGRRFLSSNFANGGASYEGRDFVPLRKQLKDEAKARRLTKDKRKGKQSSNVVEGWELTVGIEVHAQLDTDTKLFSGKEEQLLLLSSMLSANSAFLMLAGASGAIDSAPNSNVALFDLAFPGSQPVSILYRNQTIAILTVRSSGFKMRR